MFYRFWVSGVRLEPYRFPDGSEIIPGGQMKSQARRASHRVPGAEERVGPAIRFERYGRIYKRPLSRREIIFGVRAPEDGKGGGFKGVAIWRDPDPDSEGLGEVLVDLARAKWAGFRSEEEVVRFVREVILAAGWTIEKEERR